ncbi:peptidase domain-containing ABC transporter [Hellea sp.]|nr:peptidase domain-containing ABC transporter [Hellea sp.]
MNFLRTSKLPIILQTEATECGLACLAMIANFHQHRVNLNGLRAQYPISLRGVTLKNLVEISSNLDLESRAIRTSMQGLEKLQLPAILHWDMNHFVVLSKVLSNSLVIHDPAHGIVKITKEEASDHFTGIALELFPSLDFEKQEIRASANLSLIWGKLVGLKLALTKLFVLSIMLQILVLAAPFYMQLVVDEAITKFDQNILTTLALAFFLLLCFQILVSWFRQIVVINYGHQMSFQMVSNIFTHLVQLKTGYYEKRHIGDILSRISSTNPIKTFLTQNVVAVVLDSMTAILTGIIIFTYDFFLGMVVFGSTVLMLLVSLVFYPILHRSQEELIFNEAHESTFKIETIRSNLSIRLFGAHAQRLSKWRNLFSSFISSSLNFERQKVHKDLIIEFISKLQAIIVIYAGAKLVLDQQVSFSVGMLFAFLAFRQSFTDSITSLFSKYIEFRLLSLHLERLGDITSAKKELTSSNSFEAISGSINIEIRNLSFRYSENDPWVLQNLNLKINEGEFIAIIGKSGGGKTTLLKLILGLYYPTDGEILINGTRLSTNNINSWRQTIGVVMQDDNLLSGSIADNISFFDPDMKLEQVIEAAKFAEIHESIISMPMGYNSLIGDMGTALSGGQIQRIVLARAWYRNPKVLILDEGTANLDRETEISIVNAIERADCTRVVVAHREEFIKRADRTIEV